MNNEREGWEFKRNTIETNPKDEIQNKGNKKNNYKYKENDRNYEYGAYKKHIKKNEYVDKGRINNENIVYKKNHKKKRENNYEINDRFSENIEEFDINNQNQLEERTKHKNYTQLQSNNTKKNYYNHNNNNQINNINNNTNSNLNNSNDQNPQKNINQFNYYQDNQINNINYINNNNNSNNNNNNNINNNNSNNNNNNKNGLVKNYNKMLNQQQYLKFNNIKQFNNKNKNNNTNLSMTTSMIQIQSGNSLENQIDQMSNLNTENSTNTNLSMSLNSDNLSSKNQSYFSNYTCQSIPNYGNDMFSNNINKQMPPSYINDQLYFNRIPIPIFNLPMNPVNVEQNGMFNYPAFTMNSINQNNNMIINNNDNIKESKKKNILGKNKGNRSNQGNKNLIPNNNNNITNLNFNNTFNNGLFINQNQPVTHYKKTLNKKLGFRKLNSDKNIPLNNFIFIPQKNIINNNKTINQNLQKKEQIFPFNNLILKLKLPNGIESTDLININYLDEDFQNIIQKNINNNNLNPILNESIYNKIIMSLELANTIFSNNISKYERIKLDDLRNYYESQKDDDVLSNYSIEDILEYHKFYDMINEIKIDKNDIKNFEILNYTF